MNDRFPRLTKVAAIQAVERRSRKQPGFDRSLLRDGAALWEMAAFFQRLRLALVSSIPLTRDAPDLSEIDAHTLLWQGWRAELASSPTHFDVNSHSCNVRHTVPVPESSRLADAIAVAHHSVYSELNGREAAFNSSFIQSIRCASPEGAGADYAGRKLAGFRLRDIKKSPNSSDPALNNVPIELFRGSIEERSFANGEPPLGRKPLRTFGQILYVPELWKGGPAYLNTSGWTRIGTYVFRKSLVGIMEESVAQLIARDSPCFRLFELSLKRAGLDDWTGEVTSAPIHTEFNFAPYGQPRA